MARAHQNVAKSTKSAGLASQNGAEPGINLLMLALKLDAGALAAQCDVHRNTVIRWQQTGKAPMPVLLWLRLLVRVRALAS